MSASGMTGVVMAATTDRSLTPTASPNAKNSSTTTRTTTSVAPSSQPFAPNSQTTASPTPSAARSPLTSSLKDGTRLMPCNTSQRRASSTSTSLGTRRMRGAMIMRSLWIRGPWGIRWLVRRIRSSNWGSSLGRRRVRLRSNDLEEEDVVVDCRNVSPLDSHCRTPGLRPPLLFLPLLLPLLTCRLLASLLRLL